MAAGYNASTFADLVKIADNLDRQVRTIKLENNYTLDGTITFKISVNKSSIAEITIYPHMEDAEPHIALIK